MGEASTKRRLAAILAADVVGFSRLMQRDESGTLALLKERHREVVTPLIGKHSGRIFKLTGDGLLAEFASAVNAALCAIELQQQMAALNDNCSEGQRLVLRIGINLGDIIVDGDDLFGDGVNIAARLESLAEPGGVVLSGSAYDQVKNKIENAFDDLGPQVLKNIAEPVRVYRIGATSTTQSEAEAADKPSIAVLPFANLSGNSSQDPFCDGITENIITGLSRFHDLFVIASNSSFVYKGKAVNVRDASRELGARYILEGSVQLSPTRVRITAQLIDGGTARHLWAERYDRGIDDIFSVQDEVTEMIIGTLASTYGGRLRKAWQNRAELPGTRSIQALDLFMRGMDALNRFTPSDNARARDLFGQASHLDPNFAKPVAKISWSHIIDIYLGWSTDPAGSWDKGLEFAKLAIAKDDGEAWGHYALAGYLMYKSQHERAISEFEIALTLNPNDADIVNDFGLCLSYAGEPERGLELVRKAIRLNPHHPEFYVMQLGQVLFDCRRYGEAIATLESLRGLDTALMRIYLAASLTAGGRPTDARLAVERLLLLDPTATISRWTQPDVAPYRNAADLEHLRENLSKAGLGA